MQRQGFHFMNIKHKSFQIFIILFNQYVTGKFLVREFFVNQILILHSQIENAI